MSANLIFLFFLQGGLAFAFSYFMTRVILSGSPGESVTKGIRKIRAIIIALAVFLPVVMFAAYYKSLPEEQPVSLALWPAMWIFVIMMAIVCALSLALLRNR